MATRTTKAKPKPDRPARPVAPLPAACLAPLSKGQVMQALNVSLRTLAAMRSAGEFPPADFKLGKSPRWTIETFNAWVERRARAGRPVTE